MAAEKSITEMTSDEILAYVNRVNDNFTAGFLDFDNELEFSIDTLINLMAGITYLDKSGTIPNAEEVFGELSKQCEAELSRRLGVLPYTE
jgi:hypothetical protein